MRYIESDALLEHMWKRYEELRYRHGDYDHYTEGYGDGIDAVENAPTFEVATVLVEKKITREQVSCLKGKEFKDYIKRNMANELAHYLLENGYIHFDEDRDKDIITIVGLLDVVKEVKENGK